MGNWRTVHIQGTCGAGDVPALREFLDLDFAADDWGCLHSGGLAGLQNWAGETIDVVGNLGERGFDPDDVATELRKIIDSVAPTLRVKVDCGDDFESLTCVATVIVGEDSTVAVVPPSVASGPEIDPAALQDRFLRAITRPL
jgi:hypothetical protein